eukprot:7255363-Karenia_brevis.AAC.1
MDDRLGVSLSPKTLTSSSHRHSGDFNSQELFASHATPARIDGSTQVESLHGHASPILIDASTQMFDITTASHATPARIDGSTQ